MKQLFWAKGPIKILGIDIHPDPEVMEGNYITTLSKMDAIIDTWKKRKVNILGKITLVNSLIASQLMYKCMVFSVTK